jgi:hypothetical protein
VRLRGSVERLESTGCTNGCTNGYPVGAWSLSGDSRGCRFESEDLRRGTACFGTTGVRSGTGSEEDIPRTPVYGSSCATGGPVAHCLGVQFWSTSADWVVRGVRPRVAGGPGCGCVSGEAEHATM